ncbi:MAG: metalloregulator ArsR/SmtB family transcription factor [Oscillospiraceae bacterium]|nr:metalloregulator ArsR/SmtB family transcription factor [Oscillospiraceae bacterium]
MARQKAELTPGCDVEAINEEVVEKVSGMMPPAAEFFSLADLYKTYSDPTRVKILWALNCHEMCVCDLAALLNMTKSAISHQLKTLRMSNIVKFQKQGKSVRYSLSDDHVKDIFEKGFDHIRHG